MGEKLSRKSAAWRTSSESPKAPPIKKAMLLLPESQLTLPVWNALKGLFA